jgi:PAS domain S-box-containing protein
MRTSIRKFFTHFGLYASVALICLVFSAVLWTALLVQLNIERERIIESKRQQNNNLAKVFEEHVARTIRAAEVTLQEIIAEYQRAGRKFDIIAYAKDHGTYLDPYNILSFVDEKGDLVLASPPLARVVSMRHADTYQFHARNNSPAIYIGQPRKGATTGKWTVYLTRRVNKADGSFGGLWTVGMDPAYFSKIYAELDLGQDSIVTLVGLDGVVRARSAGGDQNTGQSLAASALFTRYLPAQSNGSFIGSSPLDQITRINSYRSLKDYPLVVLIGTSQADALAEHNINRSHYLQAAGVTTVLILSLGLFALFQIRRSERANEERHRSDKIAEERILQLNTHLTHERDFVSELLNTAPIIILLLDNRGMIQHVNAYFERLTGYRLDEVKDKEWFSTFLPVRDQDRIRALFQAATHDVPTRGKINIIVTRSGEEREIEWNDQVMRDAQGQVMSLLAIGQDVTGRRAMEAAMRISSERLNEAQRIAHMGSWELDLVTGTLDWSDEIFRLFEIDQTRFGATYEAFLHAIHPDDRDAVNAAYVRSLQSRQPYEIKHRLLMADGRIKHVHERCESDFDAQGKPLRSIGTVQDITELTHAEEAIRKLNAELEDRVEKRTLELSHSLEQLRLAQTHLVQTEKMAALGGLVAGVAHEINTPIGIGVTAASHLQDKVKALAARYQGGVISHEDLTSFILTASEACSMVLANLQRAADLIRSFKQVAVDQSSDQRRHFHLKTYLEDVLHSLKPQFSHAGHQVSLACPPAMELYSHPGAFSQIITNLVMNSLLHGFEGMEAGHISIDVSEQSGWLLLRYTDDGRGIAPEHLARIFEPFYTTKRGQGGSGLGLHVIYNLITQGLGGSIICRSTPGQGVLFEILIPGKSLAANNVVRPSDGPG